MKYLLFLAVVLAGVSCVASKSDLHSTQDREITLGVVQRDIRVGMSQADVAAALGSPNIVTKDGEGDESWIYDKLATEVSSSASENYFTIILLGGGSSKNYAASSQKTLTVVIKFDKGSKVKTVSYHSSKF